MKTNTRKLLKLLNQTLYLLSIAMLLSGLVLTVAAKPVAAATGSVWTTDVCGTGAQDANHYAVGAHIYVNYTGLGAGSHAWEITYTNKPGKPIVSVVGDPSIQGTGSVSGNAGCFDAWTVQPEEAGYEFKIDVDGKQDSYGVDNPTPTATTPAPTTPAPTTPAPTTPAPTTPVPTTPVPTETTPAPTEISPTPTESTPTPTEATPTPTEIAPTPTDPTPAPTETTPPATETTPAPTQPTPTNPAPTNPAPTATNPVTTEDPATSTPTAIATLPIPAAGNRILIPVTGADVSNSMPASSAPRSLFLSGLSFFGIAMVINGLRRRYDL